MGEAYILHMTYLDGNCWQRSKSMSGLRLLFSFSIIVNLYILFIIIIITIIITVKQFLSAGYRHKEWKKLSFRYSLFLHLNKEKYMDKCLNPYFTSEFCKWVRYWIWTQKDKLHVSITP